MALKKIESRPAAEKKAKGFPFFQKFILHSRLEKHIEIRVIPHILFIFII